jgi:hypothetical protein
MAAEADIPSLEEFISQLCHVDPATLEGQNKESLAIQEMQRLASNFKYALFDQKFELVLTKQFRSSTQIDRDYNEGEYFMLFGFPRFINRISIALYYLRNKTTTSAFGEFNVLRYEENPAWVILELQHKVYYPAQKRSRNHDLRFMIGFGKNEKFVVYCMDKKDDVADYFSSGLTQNTTLT